MYKFLKDLFSKSSTMSKVKFLKKQKLVIVIHLFYFTCLEC